MPVAQSRITSLTLTLLAGIVLTACSSKPEPELKKGDKAIDVAAVVRHKMPASVNSRLLLKAARMSMVDKVLNKVLMGRGRGFSEKPRCGGR